MSGLLLRASSVLLILPFLLLSRFQFPCRASPGYQSPSRDQVWRLARRPVTVGLAQRHVRTVRTCQHPDKALRSATICARPALPSYRGSLLVEKRLGTL